MTIDHLTWAIWPGFQTIWYVYLLHIIGRLTAPIMWFFIAEGCHYTKSPGKYFGRLFVFAVISHFAYNFASGFSFIPILLCYNGERGTWKGMKWFFYLYYPAHLVVIGFIRIALHGSTRLVF